MNLQPRKEGWRFAACRRRPQPSLFCQVRTICNIRCDARQSIAGDAWPDGRDIMGDHVGADDLVARGNDVGGDLVRHP